jgi:hypothetical protein
VIAVLPGVGGSCFADISPGNGRLESDASKVFAISVTARPAYLAPTVDPIFKTTITRIVDEPGTTIPGIGVWGKNARHNYPKNQAWNSDGSLLAIENRSGGTPSMILLDGETYQPKAAMPGRAARGALASGPPSSEREDFLQCG